MRNILCVYTRFFRINISSPIQKQCCLSAYIFLALFSSRASISSSAMRLALIKIAFPLFSIFEIQTDVGDEPNTNFLVCDAHKYLYKNINMVKTKLIGYALLMHSHNAGHKDVS